MTKGNRHEMEAQSAATATASIETPSEARPRSMTEEEELEEGHFKPSGLTLANLKSSTSKKSVMLQIDSDILERISNMSNMNGDSDDG